MFTFCDITKPNESLLRCLLVWVAVCRAVRLTGRLRIWIGHWLTGLFSAVDSKLLTTARKQMGAITDISQFSSSCSVWVNTAVIHSRRDREIRNTIAPNLNLATALCLGPGRSGYAARLHWSPMNLPQPFETLTSCSRVSLWAPQIFPPPF